MARVIENYNPTDITEEFILSNDWDYIILNKKVDPIKIKQWWHDVNTTLVHLKFNFTTNTHLIKPALVLENGQYGYKTNATDNKVHNQSLGNEALISSYTLMWPVQQDKPLPPPWAANIAQFPELSEFIDDNNVIIKNIDPHTFVYQDPYMFGEFKNIYEEWGKDFFVNTRITIHDPGMVVPLHSDGFVTRLHIPMTEDNSKFFWGECWDREYKWEVGNAYLINSHITHSTTNFGPSVRANILTSIDDDKILDLLRL